MKLRLAAALAAAFVGTALAEPGITPTTIVIGQVAGFTGSVAGTVKELTGGAQMYFNAVNAKGGVHGRKIVLESADDGFDPKRTPDTMKKLIDEKNVFAMFLARGTPTTEAGYPILEAAKVPLIGPSTGAMSMYSPPRKYLFPVRASYHSETFKIVPQLVNMGINRIAIVHVDDSFGKDGLAGVQQAMKNANLTPVAVVSHPRGSPPKVEEAVASIAKADPQAVIMVTVPTRAWPS
jgi:ABC-type branched-subunit amino acid transport system substrate-binding protein